MYFWKKRQKRGRERREGGGKISHFRMNTSSEVFRDFQRFSEIFRDFQGFSEIFRDFQEFNVFWGERRKKGMERRGKEETKYPISSSENLWESLKICDNP